MKQMYETENLSCLKYVLVLQKRLVDKKAEKTTLVNKIDVKKNRSVIKMILLVCLTSLWFNRKGCAC